MFDWLGQRFFDLIHANCLVYGACWEDPRADRLALQIGPTDRLLVITSAGCNALDYLLDEPASIQTVDVNYRQNALLDLKLAAIAELDWEPFFAMFGRGHDPAVRERYNGGLRRRLRPQHQRFWDRHIGLFCGQRSFYHRTTSGYLASWFRWYVDRVVKVGPALQALLDARTLAEQRLIYDQHLKDRFWHPALTACLRRTSVLALTGVPPDQRQQILRYQPDMLAYLRERAEWVIYNLPLRENYFWRAYVNGQFTPDCCPRYLRVDGFDRLKGLVDRVSLATSSIADYLQSSAESFSHFVLLDHMDWLVNRKRKELQEEWQAIVDHATRQATLVWRSLGTHVDFLDNVQIKVNGDHRMLNELLEYDRGVAQKMQKVERANAYGSTYVAKLRSASDGPSQRYPMAGNATIT